MKKLFVNKSLSMTLVLTIIFMQLTFVGITTVSAGTLARAENFNSYTSGESLNGVDGWTVTNATTGNRTARIEGDSTAHGNKFFGINAPATGNVDDEASLVFTPITGEFVIKYKAQVKVDISNQQSLLPYIYGQKSDGTADTNAIRIFADTSGSILTQGHDGDSSQTTVASGLANNSWYTVIIRGNTNPNSTYVPTVASGYTADRSSTLGTWNLTVYDSNNTALGSTTEYLRYAMNNLSRIRFLFKKANTGKLFIDDLIIYSGSDYVPVTGVTTDSTMEMAVNQTTAISAAVTPSNATCQSLSWTTSNSDVATVDQNGNVTAVSNGTAVITAATVDGSYKSQTTVVIPQAVTGVSLNKTETTISVIGSGDVLVATVLPENATNKNVTWSSSNPSVATVDQSGNVTPVSVGNTIITVETEDGGYIATCNVYVVSSVIISESVVINKRNVVVSLEDGGETLQATVYPTNTSDKTITWSSSNTDVVTVDSNGKITPVTEGTAIICATNGDSVGICNVKVISSYTTVFDEKFNYIENTSAEENLTDGTWTFSGTSTGSMFVTEGSLKFVTPTGVNQTITKTLPDALQGKTIVSAKILYGQITSDSLMFIPTIKSSDDKTVMAMRANGSTKIFTTTSTGGSQAHLSNLTPYESHTYTWVIDTETDKIDIYINNVYNSTVDFRQSADDIKTIMFGATATSGQFSFWLDNFSVKAANTVGIDNAVFGNNESVAGAQNVSVLQNSMVFTFSDDIDESTLSNIEIINNVTGLGQDYTYIYNSSTNMLTITLDAVMDFSTEYTVDLSKVKDSKGMGLLITEDYTFATVDNITVKNMEFLTEEGGTPITSVDGLSSVTGHIVFDNNTTEEKSVTLIIALYKDRYLISADFETMEVDAGRINAELFKPLAIEEPGNDYVLKMFVWDSFDSMMPITLPKEL